MEFLTRFFTWWNGATMGTLLYTRRNGEKVGEDEAGNVFYQTKDGKRRWVIYNGVAEASRVSPQWHGWLHHTWDQPPSSAPLKRKPWEKPHRPNPTGTPEAWRLPGSLMTPQTRPHVAGDYEAWRPE
jgi:NADH:ubiquinone oxidoreductase subunit